MPNRTLVLTPCDVATVVTKESMSPGAVALLKRIRSIASTAAIKDFAKWHFDAGTSDAEHTELAQLGLLMKVLGTRRGFAWRLTQQGRDWPR